MKPLDAPVNMAQILEGDSTRIDMSQVTDYSPEQTLEERLACLWATGKLGAGYAGPDGGHVSMHVFTSLEAANECAAKQMAIMQRDGPIAMGAKDDTEGFDPEAYRTDTDGLAAYDRERIFYVERAESMVVVFTSCRIRAHVPRPRQGPEAPPLDE